MLKNNSCRVRDVATGIWLLILIAACAPVPVNNEALDVSFSQITSDYTVADQHNYGCNTIDETVLRHVLRHGSAVNERELHDNYSLVGCTIKGSLFVSGQPTTFTFDYGGIMRIANGTVLACGKHCCSEQFEYCSWDKKAQ